MSAKCQFHPVKTRQPLRRVVAQQIENQIIDGELRPGDYLPTESELCDQFNVSRTVVREALLILRQLGLLESRRGVGTRVAESIPQRVSHAFGRLLEVQQVSVWEAHELREILEPVLAALAAERADEEDLGAMTMAVDSMHEDRVDEEHFIEADVRFHAAVAAATKNSALGLILVPILDVLLESRRLGVAVPGAIRKATVQHQRILDCIRARDPSGAREGMLNHLRLVARHMRKAQNIGAEPDQVG